MGIDRGEVMAGLGRGKEEGKKRDTGVGCLTGSKETVR